MTRFARAKGSKASNERAPEEGTPWEVMKEQLLKAKQDSEEAKKRHEAEQKRIENYENFLKERKIQKRQATWCDFPESKPIKKSKVEKNKDSKKEKKKHKVIDPITSQKQVQENNTETKEETKNNKKKKSKKNKVGSLPENQPNSESEVKHKSNTSDTEYNTSESKINNLNDNKFQKNKNNNNDNNFQKNKNKSIDNNFQKNRNNNFDDNKNKQKKNKKFIQDKPQRRKEINDQSFQLIVNGREVELARVDGFPVMKKDADRLSELKRNMIQKGIPKSEILRTMKLERRRAEKALTRIKKDVCYNCRKGGHNLSDCPELKFKIPGVDGADGVCFKCGSTEHRQFECKVQRDKEFRFASCFICKEQGHIARQCPDNPKGLYPNGGACKLCGDVTHLRKDCPTVKDQREESNIKLQTIDAEDNLESVGQKVKSATETTKQPKKVKF